MSGSVLDRNKYNKKFYNSKAYFYDQFLNKILLPLITGTGTKRHYKSIAALVSDIHTSKILDLACGTGNIIEYLQADNTYIGLDLAENMISHAEQRIKQHPISNYRFINAPAHDIPFTDQEFDVVICNLALHFFPDHKKVIAEVARVLKPNGVFIGCVPIIGYNLFFDRLWQNLSRKSFRWGIPLNEKDIRVSCENSVLRYKHIDRNGTVTYFKAVKP